MAECIAMAVGFVLGAGCVMFAFVQIERKYRKIQNEPIQAPVELAISEKKAAKNQEISDKEREKLRKQWENFLNYAGTGEGQMQIGDE